MSFAPTTPQRPRASTGGVTTIRAGPRRTTAEMPVLQGSTAGAAPRPKGVSLQGVGLFVALLLAGSLAGSGYYLAPAAEQVRSPLHAWLRPSGFVGQTAGIVSLLIFFFLWLYPLRKKFRWLAWTGMISKWLDVHIATALTVPVIAAIHASWRFEGVIGLGYWSMMVVVLSGVVGRYLYVHIPRSASGLELSAEEIAAERRGLVSDIATATRLPIAQVESLLQSDPSPCDGLNLWQTLARMARDDRARWRSARALRRCCAEQPGATKPDRRQVNRVLSLARREMSLTQQARMLEASRRIFRFWHVAHRPFAIAALVAVLVHVGVVVAMGATWFW
ncbi:MAG: hypothetical protein ABI587_13105 [Gemmatimonadales bacterium]